MASIPLCLKFWLTLGLLYALKPGAWCLDTGLNFTFEPRDAVAIKNEPFLLNCTVSSDSEHGEVANITWHKDGSLVNDARRSVMNNGSLYFQRFIAKRQRGRNDEGYYECVARNHIGTILSRKALIQVASFSGLLAGSEGVNGGFTTESPSSTTQGLSRISGDVETSKTVTVGEVVRLNCSIEASPQPVYSWEKDRTPLPQSNRYVFLPSGVLEIQQAQSGDAGRYRCSASVGIGTQNTQKGRPLELIVQDSGSDAAVTPTLLSPTHQHFTRNVNSSVILECAASGFPQPTVVWTRNDGSSVDTSRHRILGQGNLEITSLTLRDADDYTCSVISPQLSEPLVATATLRVMEPPFVISRQENLEHRMPKMVTFTNEFGGSPEPTYTWFKNGQPFVSNGRVKPEGPRLTITQSQTTDSGYYQCRAENEAGVAQVTMRLLIKQTKSPPLTPTNLTAVEVTATSVSLAWESSESNSGEPIIAYTVHYMDETNAGLEFQKVVQSTNTVIDELKPHTNYSFYVVAYVASAASESSSKLIKMTSDAVPKGAPDTRVKPLGANSLKVEWDDVPPKMAQGVITGFRVIYREHNDATWNREYLPGTEREFIILNLEPDVRYDVRVSPGTSAGYYTTDDNDLSWPWQSAITRRRSESGAPDQPQVSAQAVNSTAIHVTWEIHPSGPDVPEVNGYQLNYREIGEQQQQRRVRFNDLSRTSYTIGNLKPSTWYQIGFLAENEFGESEPDVKEVATIGDEVSPPRAPDTVQVHVVSSTTVSISWLQPQSELPIVSYDIRYRVSPDQATSSHEDDFIHEFTEGDQLNTEIHNLAPYTDYEFSVRAHTDQSNGPYSKAFSCRTYEGVPSAPLNAFGRLYNSTTVMLSWQPPAESNGAIMLYLIFYTENRSLDDGLWKTKMANGSQLTSTVFGLHENSVYYFKLKASTTAGVGPDSSVLTISTSPAPLTTTTSTVVPGLGRHTKDKEKQMGIIVGVAIGLAGCSVAILIIIILRSKCNQPHPAAATQSERTYIPPHCNGVVTNINGNGYLGHGNSQHTQEMDSFLPILQGVPENEHSDTKGGYSMLVPPTPPQNGLVPNGLCVKYLQNGQVTTSLTHSSDDDGPGPQVPLRSTSLRPQDSCPAEEDDEGGGEDEGGGGYPWRRQSSLDGIDHEDPEPSHQGVHPITDSLGHPHAGHPNTDCAGGIHGGLYPTTDSPGHSHGFNPTTDSPGRSHGGNPATDSPGRSHGPPQFTSTPLRASDHARSSPRHQSAAQPRTTSLHSQRGGPPAAPAHIDSDPTSRPRGGGPPHGRPANVDRVGPSSQDDYSGRHRQNTQQVL